MRPVLELHRHMGAELTCSGTAMAATEASRTARRKQVADPAAGFSVTLFFIFVLMNFAIYSLMFCSVGSTLLGIGLLSFALLLTITSYLAGV